MDIKWPNTSAMENHAVIYSQLINRTGAQEPDNKLVNRTNVPQRPPKPKRIYIT
jgi:hypothetical protein